MRRLDRGQLSRDAYDVPRLKLSAQAAALEAAVVV